MATVAENLQAIIDIKSDIKTAIENKGVDMSNTTFSNYANKIGEISGGVGKIDVGAMGLKFGNSTFTTIPDVFDFSNITDVSGMFNGCKNLLEIPLFDTSNVTDMSYMFDGCKTLLEIPSFDTSNVTDMSAMFQSAGLVRFPQLNTSKVVDIGFIFSLCEKLVSTSLLDCSNVTGADVIFQSNNSLTDIAGFLNLGKQELDTEYPFYYLYEAPNLTRQSCINIFNTIYDLSNTARRYNINLHTDVYNRLSSDDIAIATNKGWIVNSRT